MNKGISGNAAGLRSFRRAVTFGYISRAVLTLSAFVIKSLIITRLGTEYVGLGSLFSSVLQVLSLTELGFGTALIYKLYKPVADNDTDKICALLAFYRRVCLITGSVILGAGLLIMPLLPKLIVGNVPADINLYALYLIYLINAADMYFIYGYSYSLYEASQRIDMIHLISMISSTLMALCQIAALIFTRSYYLYIVFLPLFNLAGNAALYLYGKKLFPGWVCRGMISAAEKKEIYRSVSGIALSRLSAVSRSSFDSIIISMFLGLAVLGRYQSYFTVIAVLTTAANIFTNALRSNVGKTVATRGREDIYREFRVISLGYRLLAGWCCICLICLYQPFVRLWIGAENTPSFPMVLLLSLFFYVSRLEDSLSIYKDTAGLYAKDKLRPVLESAANLILNILLVKRFGVFGVAAATVLSIVCINLPMSVKLVFSSCFCRRAGDYLAELVRDSGLFILFAALTYGLCLLIPSERDLITLLVRGAVCLTVPAGLYYLLFRKNEAYLAFIRLLRSCKDQVS